MVTPRVRYFGRCEQCNKVHFCFNDDREREKTRYCRETCNEQICPTTNKEDKINGICIDCRKDTLRRHAL